jgi:hypothetical protein
MNNSNTKSCPRCNIEFECNSSSIENCQCNIILLSDETKKQLQDQYQDCLCINCLKEIQTEFDLKSNQKKN